MKLTHVDSKGNYTTEELFRRVITVTRKRVASMSAAAATAGVSAPVHWATRQYITEYLVGDPPQRAEALIDTGSDLIWTQSTTCLRKLCAKQDLPYFNASASSTFSPVPCRDASCAANYVHLCGLDGGCTFGAFYGAGTVLGFLGTDAFVFGSGEATLAFGLSSGGDGPVSSMAFVESPKVYPYSTFYYLPLMAISIAGVELAIPSSAFELREIDKGYWSGGVIVDSGSPFTTLVDAAYQPLAGELSRQLNASLVPPPENTGSAELCVARGDVDEVVPEMVFHFAGGADMAVPPENYWAPVDKSTACLAIVHGYDQNIIGNFQQQNLHLLFDVGWK
nr:unnamed protein product [Digitaria exilis]